MPLALFYPTIYRRRITDITLDDLEELGVRGLLLDVDNTLTTHGASTSPRRCGIGSAICNGRYRPDGRIQRSAQPVGPFAEKIGLRYTAFSASRRPSDFGGGSNAGSCRNGRLPR